MIRGPITNPSLKGQFSGHETFPLRHLWLRKAYDAVEDGRADRSVFTRPDAIVTFGVGKNMALAIRHWACAAGVIEEVDGRCRPTELSRRLFDGRTAWDPFTEHPATAWLVHWRLASDPKQTTAYWAFNHLAAQVFQAEQLVSELVAYAQQRGWPRVAEKTVVRDVECFLRSYAPRTERAGPDDLLEPVLAELDLVRPLPARAFEFRRGPKPTLPNGVFAFALHEFWTRHAPAGAATLSVEAVAYEPGSPGRVFKLDEGSVVERLVDLEEDTDGAFAWSDSAGVRQVSRRRDVASALDLLAPAYRPIARKPRS